MKFRAQSLASSSNKAASFAPYLRPYLDEFEEITHSLAYDNRFSLVPVEVPTMDIGQGFARYLELSGRKVRRIEPAPGQWRDLARLLKSLPKVEHEIVIILGPRERPADLSEGLNVLNFSRDSIDRHLGRPLVLCGAQFFLNAVLQNAPDLWSFREITYVVKSKITPYDPETESRPLLWFEPTDEPDDVRLQLEVARADHDEPTTGRLSLRLARAYLARYRLADAERALTDARTMIEGNASFRGSREVASCLETAGDFAYGKGDLNAAQNAYSEALDAFEKLADAHDSTRLLGKLGLVHHTHSDPKWVKLAAYFYEKANEESERLGDQSIRAPLLYYLGSFYRQRGDVPRAIQCLDEAIALFRSMTDRLGEGYVHLAYAEVHQHRDDVTQALADVIAAEEIFTESHYAPGQASALELRGFIQLDKLADFAHAIRSFGAARTIYEREGNRFRAGRNALALAVAHILLDQADHIAILRSANSWRIIAHLYQSRPWLDAAKEDLDRAISIFEEVGDERKKSIAYRRRGDFAHSRGQVIAAIHDYQEAIEADSKSGDYGVEAPARQGLAEVYTDIGDSDGAIEQLTRVLELLPSNAIIGRVGTFIALSIAKRIRGNLDEALAHLMEARRILLQGKPDAQFEECQSKIAAHMAMVHLLAGRIDEARTNAEEAGQLATKGNTPFALQVSIAIKTLLENFKPKTAIRIMRALTSMGRWFRAVRFWHIRRRMKPNNRGRAP